MNIPPGIQPENTTVVVGLSGGVDSSVSALLLKQQGFRVLGLFMRNWEEEDEQGVCRAEEDYADVVHICEQIGIPYYTVNLSRQYWDRVFSRFLDELRLGHTPNPDVLCNKEIKFSVFLDKAKELGGDFLATGHYCRTQEIEGRHHLLRGCDANKDQSYFLHTVTHDKLAQALFPIGHLPKPAVRDLAQKHGLATALKKDSTGICFIGKRDFKEFVSKYLPKQSGAFITPDGTVVGQHDGALFYTIGQRKGLGIGGPGEPWFVVAKDIQRNIVTVVQGENHPLLYRTQLTASSPTWVVREPQIPLRCTAKVRYRQADIDCTITSIEHGRLHVEFAQPVKAITSRQSIVFYEEAICLGGAFIDLETNPV